MEYNDFLTRVQNLGFIHTQDRADAATKAVLGILASRMKEEDARRLVDRLPEPLTYDKLRGHQANATNITAQQYVDEIAEQFHLDREEAKALVATVLHAARETVGEDTFQQFSKHVPPDWAAVLRAA